MAHREGTRETGDVRLAFERCVRLEFRGSKISSEGRLLLFRELTIARHRLICWDNGSTGIMSASRKNGLCWTWTVRSA